MTIDIQPIDPVNRAFFAGVVSGLDLDRPLSAEDVAAVHAGMDRFAVLVFHDQPLTTSADRLCGASATLSTATGRQRLAKSRLGNGP